MLTACDNPSQHSARVNTTRTYQAVPLYGTDLSSSSDSVSKNTSQKMLIISHTPPQVQKISEPSIRWPVWAIGVTITALTLKRRF